MGTSICALVDVENMGDHPHACGDKVDILLSQIPFLGSSPRVWGQVFFADNSCGAFRIIPTRVGTRILPRYYHTWGQDHPHACGDKKYNLKKPFPLSGSSPRVWGQACGDFHRRRKTGIIPTRVGTSLPHNLGTS